MKEIGGYIELDSYSLPMLHENAIALNCGRNCLAYLIHTKNIRKMLLPYFLCDSVRSVCEREKVEVRYYHIAMDFRPVKLELEKDEWLYVVNYYGQLDNKVLAELAKRYAHVIVDNVQAYFQMPLSGVDTLYTCRKFFGVADGAFLYSDVVLEEDLSRDESYHRMNYLLGRFERTASDFYDEYVRNDRLFEREPIKRMSRLTDNLLRGIDYESIKRRRTENYTYLYHAFKKINLLELTVPEGAFMYPLYLPNGNEIRITLQKEKIYIPTLWPDVSAHCRESDLEFDMAGNILPLPVDQRYGREDMEVLIEKIVSSRRQNRYG